MWTCFGWKNGAPNYQNELKVTSFLIIHWQPSQQRQATIEFSFVKLTPPQCERELIFSFLIDFSYNS